MAVLVVVATVAAAGLWAASPSANIPISAMPATTNALDTAYMPLIQPFPGRTTNDNFKVSVANLFAARGTIIASNVYVTNLCATNLYATNIYSTNLYTSNFYTTNLYTSNIITTNLYATNIYVTNLYASNFYATNIVIGGTNVVNGQGTPPYLPIWTGTGTLGDSVAWQPETSFFGVGVSNLVGYSASGTSSNVLAWGVGAGSNLVAQEAWNIYLAGFQAGASAVLTNGASTYLSGNFAGSGVRATNFHDLYGTGDHAYENAVVSSTGDLHVDGYYPFAGGYAETSDQIYGWGTSPLRNSIIDNSTYVYGLGYLGGYGLRATNSYRIYGIGGLNGAVLNDSKNVMAIGTTAGDSISGAYTNLYLVGNGAVPNAATGTDEIYLGGAATTVVATNSLFAGTSLLTDGNFVTRALSSTTLSAGTNVLVLRYKSMFVLASLATNGVVVHLTTGAETGQHAWLFNFWTNASFTLPSGVCEDDTNQPVVIRGGAWTPTETGESIELVYMPNGWVEVNRAKASGGPPVTTSDALWTNNAGTLQPADLTLPLYWTNKVTLGQDGSPAIVFGPGVTNVLYRSGGGMIYTNSGTSFNWDWLGGGGTGARLTINEGSLRATLQGYNQAMALSTVGNSDGVVFQGAGFVPFRDSTTDLSGPTWSTKWRNLSLGGTAYISGYDTDSATNYSRLEIVHGGTNGVIALSSRSAGGMAGVSRPLVVNRNLGATNVVGNATYIDLFNATTTNDVSGAVAIAYATNGMTGVNFTHTRWFFNGSGSDQTLSIPPNWRTNMNSAVPPAITNGMITVMYVKSMGITDSDAHQTNCYVSFEYYK